MTCVDRVQVPRIAFMVSGVVSPELPAAFAQQGAYGDLITATVALLSTLGTGAVAVVTWVFNTFGMADCSLRFI
jgi:hypothetical protein